MGATRLFWKFKLALIRLFPVLQMFVLITYSNYVTSSQDFFFLNTISSDFVFFTCTSLQKYYHFVMKVFAYCRVSTETNKDGHGFTRQKDSINQWAKNNQSEVIEFFEEVFTGTEVERPVFAQMLEQMNAHGIKTFVVENQTRLGRDLMVNLHLIASCKKMGVGVIDASTGDDLTKQDDPMSVAMMQISGVFSQLEKSQLVSKLRKARDAKSKEHGKRIEGRKKITIPNDLILKIKQLRRKPIGKRRLTIKQVADALNIEGLLTPSGGKFHTTTVSRILKEI